MEGLKKTTSCMIVVCLLISAGLIPVVSASMEPRMINETVNNDFVEEEDHPAYYNVTRYHFKGFFYEEETIRVSYEDAMRMKKEYESIDSLPISSNEKREKKHDVLVENELLSNERTNLFSNQMYNRMRKSDSDDDKEFYFFFLTLINGTLGPSFINLLNFYFGVAPVFLTFAKGVDLKLGSIFVPESTFQSDGWVNIFVMLLVGDILVIPFFSPCGYIDALAALGGINEM